MHFSIISLFRMLYLIRLPTVLTQSKSLMYKIIYILFTQIYYLINYQKIKLNYNFLDLEKPLLYNQEWIRPAERWF
jgi:hypothetical protein